MKNGVRVLLALAALAAAAVHARPLVALDVGHSRAQPGATSARGVPEFEFNLKLAQALAAELEKAGVIVNRKEETLLSQQGRHARMANSVARGVAECLGGIP